MIMKLNSRSLINLIFFGVGIAALALLIREVGLDELGRQLGRVGLAFILILITELISNIVSARGWHLAFQPEHRPPFWRVTLTGIAALSVSGALPSGQAGEIVKGNLMRGYAPNPEIVSSLIWYNYLHVLVTSAAVLLAVFVPLFAGTFETGVTFAVVALAAVILALVAAVLVLLRLRLFERVMRRIGPRLPERLRPSERLMESARTVDERLRTFISRHPGDFVASNLWLFAGRLFNVLEVWIVLDALGLPSSPPVVAMIYAATSMANYLLMILPAREGFLEGSSYLIFEMLGLSPAGGLSFEIVRRLRKIFYQIVGLVLMLVLSRSGRRGFKGLLSTDQR
ncbi:MAG: hypothetical protein C4523_15130 [Myxococcales bacterium]|nr:MAG: hypothetical protein C4523_15130 [Myxococcales bacterium]